MIHSLSFQVLGCLAALFIFTAVPPGARAEMPPSAYESMQKESPEALTIQVLSVKISTTDEPERKVLAIAADAKVAAVQRSASGLKPGDTIRISYQVFDYKEGIAGPGKPKTLEEGKSYSAFLSKNEKEGYYRLAAMGQSFTEVAKAAPDTTPTAAELPQWRGQYEGDSEFSTQIIKTQESWSRFWSRLSRPMPQALDDSREMAVFIAVGERPTGGFSATVGDGKLVVVYADGKPSPETS